MTKPMMPEDAPGLSALICDLRGPRFRGVFQGCAEMVGDVIGDAMSDGVRVWRDFEGFGEGTASADGRMVSADKKRILS